MRAVPAFSARHLARLVGNATARVAFPLAWRASVCFYKAGFRSSSLVGAAAWLEPLDESPVVMADEVLPIDVASRAGAAASCGEAAALCAGGVASLGVASWAGAALSAGITGVVGAGSPIEPRDSTTGAAGLFFEVAACREVRGFAGAVAASLSGGLFDLPAGTLGTEASLPASSVAEPPLVLPSAMLAAGCPGDAVAIDFVAVRFGEDVTRSSAIAPPITTTVIAPSAMPKWFTGYSLLAVIPIGTAWARPVARTRKESEDAYTLASWGHTMHFKPADKGEAGVALLTVAALCLQCRYGRRAIDAPELNIDPAMESRNETHKRSNENC